MRGPLRLVAALAPFAALFAVACSGADFPDPSDPVARIVWPDYELLRYDITDQTDELIGTVDFEVERFDGEFRLRIEFLLPESGAQDELVLHVDAESLEPLRYERLATAPGQRVEVTATYGVDADGRFVDSLVIEDGEREQRRIGLQEDSFDTDSSAWLWRTLPFDIDLDLSYRSVNVFAQRSQLVSLRVRGQDQIRTPLGDFLAWQVEVRPGVDRQTAWYSVDDPNLLVRWDLEPRRYLLRDVITDRRHNKRPGG
jgi:hypothetical protein